MQSAHCLSCVAPPTHPPLPSPVNATPSSQSSRFSPHCSTPTPHQLSFAATLKHSHPRRLHFPVCKALSPYFHRPQTFKPRIHFTPSDFATITEHGTLCGPNGTLTAQQFETVMRIQLQRFSLARLAEARSISFLTPTPPNSSSIPLPCTMTPHLASRTRHAADHAKACVWQASSQGPAEAAETQFGALKSMLMHLIKIEGDRVGLGVRVWLEM
jgi:hypothetical protein